MVTFPTLKKYILTILIVSQIAPAIFAQNFGDLIKLDHFTQRDGLSNHWIRDIIQDRRGFIWIATDNGLNRFDGVRFKVYTPYSKMANPPRDDHSQRFALDHEGKLWMLDRYGLSFYDESRDNFTYAALPGMKFPVHADHHLLFDPQRKCFWLVTSSGIFRYDLATNKLLPTAITGMYRPFESLIDQKGNLVVAASEGAFVYNIAKNTFRFEQIDNDQNEHCTSIFQDKNNAVWMGRWGKGLMHFDVISGEVQHFFPPEKLVGFSEVVIQDIGIIPELTGDSVLWISTLINGFLLFDLNKKEFTGKIEYNPSDPNGLATNAVNLLYRARDHIYWIANTSLSKLDFSNQQFKVRATKLPDNETQLTLPDPHNKNHFWFVLHKEGLVLYDLAHNKIRKTFNGRNRKNRNDLIVTTDMCFDSTGRLWASGSSGLIVIDKKLREKRFRFKSSKSDNHGIYLISLDGEDEAWLVYGLNILCHFNLKTGKQEFFDLPKYNADDSPYINSICLEKDYVWLGTYFGLYQFDKKSRKFIKRYMDYSTKDSTNLNYINYVSRDHSGKLWIAYIRNGIKSLLPSEGKLVSYPATEKYSPKFVEKDSRGKIWFQTEKGFYRFEPVTGKIEDFTTTAFSEFDGGGSPPLHSTNRLWSITSRSRYISQVSPDKVPEKQTTAKPIFTAFNIFNKPVPFNPDSTHLKPYLLEYRQNVISFEFSCPVYTRSDKITFDYMLEGFDEKWINGGSDRFVSYTNLDGGDYVFKVRAYNSLGQLHPAPAIFMIHVKTPYWRTWWFILLCVILLVALVAAVFRYREIQRRKLVHIRDEIARDLHDDMGSNLSSISILSQNIEKLSRLDPEKARLALNKISETAQDVMETMNDIVWSVNPDNDSMEHLVGRMREVAIEVWEVRDVQVSFTVDPALLKLNISPDKRRDLFLIFKEALTNAFRYSEASAFNIHLARSGGCFEMHIEDNGLGFHEASPLIRNGGNGLKNMRKRAIKLGGHLEIDTAHGQGTRILLRTRIF